MVLGHVARRARVATVAVLCLVGLVGCSDSSDGRSPVVNANEAPYRAGMQQAADCTKAKGWQVTPLVRELDGTWSFSVEWDTEPTDEENTRAAHDVGACLDEHVESTGLWSTYRQSMLLSGAERDKVYAQMIVCLKDAGVDGVSMGDTQQQVSAKVPLTDSPESVAAQQCLHIYSFQLFDDE